MPSANGGNGVHGHRRGENKRIKFGAAQPAGQCP